MLRGRHLGQEGAGQRTSSSTFICIAAPGAYICGEETGLIESLEGKRAWPRIKPPYPAIEGLFRKPTIVNNVETLCCVTHILQRGGDWFKSIGVPPDPNNKRDQGSYGPKLYCISGHVNKPCCVELPLGVTTRELIDVHGGGVWKGRKAKAVVPGGISMGFLSANELDTKLDFEGPGKVGCLGLGTAAVVVIDDQTSMVDVLYNCCRFMSHESCGQCTPCREGTSWMTKILERIRSGPREVGRHRPAARSRELDGDHSGDDDLRAVGRSGVAGEERDHEVPAASSKSTFAAGGRRVTPAQELMTAH